MAEDSGFRKMSALVASLAAAERGLSSGELDVAGLEAACADARELYERLVVLRHKAREGKPRRQEQAPEASAPIPAPAPTPVTDTEESMTIRLDTRPVETTSRQTSLIEAIEATEEDPARTPAPERPAATERQPSSAKSSTLAEKMERASITDLSKAISLSHKFWFVAELFNGDRITYEKSIDKLNAFPNFRAAQEFIEKEVIAKLKKPADPEALATFSELVQRRYT
ncbi:MAG TPA: hypothetical protein VKG92_12555 [Flavobacteriales bacterium]|nr:hypothetical protein [Flavobacteriales bacterium]